VNPHSAIEKLARPIINEMQTYEPMQPNGDAILLHANEAPNEIDVDKTYQLNRYPQNRPRRLVGQMASFYGVAEENVLVTRGSSEGIDLALRTFCVAGQDNVLLLPPTFEMYRVYASLQGAEVIEIRLDKENDFDFNFNSVSRACNDNTKIIFLCSPNNPSGTLIPQKAIEQLLFARAEKSIVVVDEAYIEFSNTKSVSMLIERHENLVVLRTLSKAFALAGARCGAILASATLIRLLSCALPPYALSSLVIDRAESVLNDAGIERMRALVDLAISERQRVKNELDQCRAVSRSWTSKANFLLVEFQDLPATLEVLRAKNILIRKFPSDPALKKCARITIGSTNENDKLLNAIRSMS